MSDSRPIGVFDSGLGGLSVLHAVHEILPDESTIYLGDLARLPYGAKSPDFIVRYTLKSANALISKADIKALVIACGSATSYALPILQEQLRIPVMGVIEPGASFVAESAFESVSILATSATVRSNLFEASLLSKGFRGKIFSLACPNLAERVEHGLITQPKTRSLLQGYLNQLPKDTDAVVLACTHFPALLPVMRSILPTSVAFINVAPAVALRLRQLLVENDLETASRSIRSREYWVTDAPSRFVRYSRNLKAEPILQSQVKLIDIN